MTWQRRARELAAEVAAQGVLDPAWREAFESVPRHVFVSVAFGIDGVRVRDMPAAVYSDRSLTTQVLRVPGTGQIVPTSSSTRPGLMALMLGMLDTAPGQTVLEIGTGTGYNSALLCHRLGSAAVTSVDIDPGLVETARTRLALLGFTPSLVAGDGADGVAARAPFDRILATCAVSAIPAQWVQQLRVGGLLVTDIRTATSSTLVTASRGVDGDLVGRFHAVPGHFMWLRPHVDDPFRSPAEGLTAFDRTRVSPAPDLDPALLDDPDFGFQLALHVPGLVQSLRLPDQGTRVLLAEDGSWVEIHADGTARQGGGRSLGEEVAAARDSWCELGRPDRSRFMLRVTPDGSSTVAPSAVDHRS